MLTALCTRVAPPALASNARDVVGGVADASESEDHEAFALEHLHLPADQPSHAPHYTLRSTSVAERMNHLCEIQAWVLEVNACPINYGFDAQEWAVVSKVLCRPSGIWLFVRRSDVSWAAHAELTPFRSGPADPPLPEIVVDNRHELDGYLLQ